MKLDFVDNIIAGASDQKIIRLYDFSTIEAALFRKSISDELLIGNKAVKVHELPFVEPINCKLSLNIGESIGIEKREDRYTCSLSRSEYMRMIKLLEPFCKRLIGYQWLFNVDSEIELLFSSNGKW